jgi:hypothetical protein
MSTVINEARVADTWANVLANLTANKSALLSDQLNEHVHRVGSTFYFPAMSKKTTDGIVWTYLDAFHDDGTFYGDLTAVQLFVSKDQAAQTTATIRNMLNSVDASARVMIAAEHSNLWLDAKHTGGAVISANSALEIYTSGSMAINCDDDITITPGAAKSLIHNGGEILNDCNKLGAGGTGGSFTNISCVGYNRVEVTPTAGSQAYWLLLTGAIEGQRLEISNTSSYDTSIIADYDSIIPLLSHANTTAIYTSSGWSFTH